MQSTCPSHELLVQRVNDIKQHSDNRDVEQETSIGRMSYRMDNLYFKVEKIEKSVDALKSELPETVTKNVTGYIDTVISRGTKAFLKWFLRFIIGGSILTIISIAIKVFMEG